MGLRSRQENTHLCVSPALSTLPHHRLTSDTWCVGSPHIKPFCNTSWGGRSHDLIQFWHHLPGFSIRAQEVKDLVPQSWSPFRCHSQEQVVTCASDQQAINRRFSRPSIILLKWLTELQKTDWWFNIKGYNSQVDEMHRASKEWGRGVELPCPLPMHPPPSTKRSSTNLSFPSWVFMKASSHRHDELNHWHWWSIWSPSHLLGRWGLGLKVPTL